MSSRTTPSTEMLLTTTSESTAGETPARGKKRHKKKIPLAELIQLDQKTSWCRRTRTSIFFGLFFTFFVQYTLRVHLNVAIVAMVKDSSEIPPLRRQQDSVLSGLEEGVSSGYVIEKCPVPENKMDAVSGAVIKPKMAIPGTFEWDERLQGVILSAYYYTFVPMQLFAGHLAESYGAKEVLGSGILLVSVLTLISPVATDLSGALGLIILRIIEGFFGGLVYPSTIVLISHWTPSHERSMMTGVNAVGASVGIISAYALTGHICTYPGWPYSFYLFGVIGCIYFVYWTMCIYNHPEDHPSISDAELSYIKQSRERRKLAAHEIIPYFKIFTSVAVWAGAVAMFCCDCGLYFLLICLPKYLNDVLHFDLQQNGTLTAGLNVAAALSVVAAASLTVFIQKREILSTTTVRKLFLSIGLISNAGCLVATTYAECDTNSVKVILVIGMLVSGFTVASLAPLPIDIAPPFSGVIIGLINCCGNIAGILVPIITGVVIEHKSTLYRWRILFFICSAVHIFGAVQFLILGSADIQEWGILQSQDSLPVESFKEERQSLLVDRKNSK